MVTRQPSWKLQSCWLDPNEPHHAACDALLAKGHHGVYLHAFAECFSTLTGGQMGRRVQPSLAAELMADSIVPFVQPRALNATELLEVLATAHQRGARGGAVYDLLHLVAARHAGAQIFYTLNLRDFSALAAPGDPEIQLP